jgi:hypothetical protein
VEALPVTVPVRLAVIAPEVIVPLVLIAVDPPIVPEVMALPLTFPAVETVARAESGRAAMAVFREMFALPSKFTPVAVTAPVNEIALGVAKVVAVVVFPTTGPVCVPAELPVRFAVIVPAEKFPEPSRATIVLITLALLAVVAELETFPAVAMVANFVSAIAADAPI